MRDKVGAVLAVLTLCVSWAYFVLQFGLLWGLALGWIPAFALAVLVGSFWPYVLVVAAVALLTVAFDPRLPSMW